MNYMKQVAVDVLGLEWNDDSEKSEFFDILNKDKTIRYVNVSLNQTGIENEKGKITLAVLGFILMGEYTIRKKLQEGDIYYYIDASADNCYKYSYYQNNKHHKGMVAKNKIYRTKSEVKKAVEVLKNELGWKVE